MPDDVHFSILGSLEVTRSRQQVRLGAARQRALLATLLLHANRPVSVAEIGERLWDHAPPEHARRAVQIYVVRLRKALACDDLIRTGPGGYLISVGPDQCDLLRFDAMLEQAAKTAGLSQRAALLAEALLLWRGPACADVASEVLQARDVPPILERRLDAMEHLADAELALGRHAAQIPRLRQLVDENPLRERFAAQLMLALYRSGRQADALAVYQRTRDLLVAELGVEPAGELQRIQRRVLAGDPVLEVRPTVPAQLPADSAAFTGRDRELARITSLPGRVRAAPVCVIDGMAGIGKTALAVHAAHRLAPQFPDGQLFIDLHGFTQDAAPVRPADALDRMLRALGTPVDEIPAEADDRAALYRSMLARRRVLVVLDNVGGDTQIRPLLPGVPGCLALVTSRRRLIGLDCTDTVSLDVLPHDDALAVLTRATGQLVPALNDIVRLCGHLPLALRTAAARLRARPVWTANHLALRLRDCRHRLAELDRGEAGLTAALDLSYRDLNAGQRRMFRLLSLCPSPDFGPQAAAAAAGTTPEHARWLLDDLQDAHLLQETGPGRYRLHELIRDYAADLADTHEPEPERQAAARRAYAAEWSARYHPHYPSSRLHPAPAPG